MWVKPLCFIKAIIAVKSFPGITLYMEFACGEYGLASSTEA
jgi:hypothetical protein